MTITPQKPLRLAFLGCGFATRLHSKTLAGFRSEVAGYYASRDGVKANEYNRRFRGHGAFASYEQALADANVEVVLIATPPAQHLDLALQALRAGKHVIVEKPPFLRSQDFNTVRVAQLETGRRVLVAENYYYKPLSVKLRQYLSEELIGEVLFVHVNALKLQRTGDWRDETQLSGGGALFEGGIHWINFIANLGLKIASISGLSPGANSSMEKSVLVSVQYAEGAVGTLYYSWEVPSLFKGLRLSKIYGRKGTITFESNGLLIVVRGNRKRMVVPDLRDIAGYRGMFRDFLNALRSGAEPAMTLALAERDVQLIEKVYQSIGRAKSDLDK